MFMGEPLALDRKVCWLGLIATGQAGGKQQVQASPLTILMDKHFTFSFQLQLVMNGCLHMLWRTVNASFLFFVMCCQLMTSEGNGYHGTNIRMYALMCKRLDF